MPPSTCPLVAAAPNFISTDLCREEEGEPSASFVTRAASQACLHVSISRTGNGFTRSVRSQGSGYPCHRTELAPSEADKNVSKTVSPCKTRLDENSTGTASSLMR